MDHACFKVKFGTCRTCDLLDREGPHYREDYRRLYFPEEFPPSEPPAPAAPVSVPAPAEATPPPTPVPTLAGIPLAGDVVEAIAHRIGADRLARLWEAKTGYRCGCADRKEAMNRYSLKLLRWAGLAPAATPDPASESPAR